MRPQPDGATPWQRFRFVTLPLTPIIAVVMTFSVLFTFTDFQLIYVDARWPAEFDARSPRSFQRAISGGSLGEGAVGDYDDSFSSPRSCSAISIAEAAAAGSEGLERTIINQCLWLLPVAYVVTDRACFVIWQLIVMSGETSVMTPAFGLVLSVACAFAAACLCVYGHYRIAGPVPMQRSFVMAAISIPVFLVAGLATMGPRGFVRYWSEVPLQAALHYAVAFFALPAAALVMSPKQAMLAQRRGRRDAGARTAVLDRRHSPESRRRALSLGLFLGGSSSSSSSDSAAPTCRARTRRSCSPPSSRSRSSVSVSCARSAGSVACSVARVTVAAISIPFAAWPLMEGDEEGVWAVVGLGLWARSGPCAAACRGRHEAEEARGRHDVPRAAAAAR
jgi:hypothetical protein